MVQFLLTFIRHGETSFNQEHRIQGQMDVPLNEVGLQQAKMVAEFLKGVIFDKIYSSDLKRASKTAEEIVSASECPVPSIVLDARLRERSFGSFEGKLRAEYNYHKKNNKNSSDGEETLGQMNERIKLFLSDLCKAAEEDFSNTDVPRFSLKSSNNQEFSKDDLYVNKSSAEDLRLSAEQLLFPSPSEEEPISSSELCKTFWDLGYPKDFTSPHILVSCHGFLMRILIGYLHRNFKCSVPGGVKKLYKKNPNTGLTGVLIETKNGQIKHSQCKFLFRADHLASA